MNVLTFTERLSAFHLLHCLKLTSPYTLPLNTHVVPQVPVRKVEYERRNWDIRLPQWAAQRSGELSGRDFHKSASFPKAWEPVFKQTTCLKRFVSYPVSA